VTPEALLPILLVAQGLVGGVDTLLNHEWIERLPHRTSARSEIGFHSMREAIYASLFGGLAWFEWHGAAAAVIVALLAAELTVTICDEVIENRTRVLPQNERVLHIFLTLNLGLLIAVLVPVLGGWAAQPTGWLRDDKGWLTWVLSAFALLGAGWSVRDFLAWRRLGRAA
jgi:hypothetical protein